VHLRFGSVARGGLRWSDRPADYRTEVLGLVKAQAVKNAVIVPGRREGRLRGARVRGPGPAEVEACYRTFISGLLDVTDNLVGGETVPPPDVVRHDADDSYLVVAADKGTAKFSDIANEVAMSYGFWLGDAFASGGSVGYDHKAMGITAKGAWESVKRHFRELGVDTQSEEFTGRRRGRHVRRRLRQRHAALPAHPAARRRSTTATCSSTPTRTRPRAFAERERMFALPARHGTTTTARRSARAAGCGRARPSGCRSGRRCAPPWASPRTSAS
jgi:glutamate dehydrogenase